MSAVEACNDKDALEPLFTVEFELSLSISPTSMGRLMGQIRLAAIQS